MTGRENLMASLLSRLKCEDDLIRPIIAEAEKGIDTSATTSRWARTSTPITGS